MRRVLLLLVPSLALLLLAGCVGGDVPPPQPPLALPGETAELRASFPPRGLVDTIEIDAIERLPLRVAVLVAPDGTTTPANYINVEANPRLATGQWSVSHAWQDAVSSGNSAIAAATRTNVQAGAALHGEEQLLATASTADIALPDPVAYHRDWRRYRIRLIFGTPPEEVETREIAAPAPPPPPQQQ